MKQIFIAAAILISGNLLFAQKTDARYDGKNIFPFGVVEEIDSKPLSEKRVLNIYLPDGYHPDSVKTYPVIYVLDGSANEDFPHIAGLVQFMNMYGLMPKSIVVGIANVDRYRDFTYPSSVKRDKKDIPTSGGSEKFIAFVEKEVQPLIEKNYKTNGHKTIVGQSLGGLLATEILFKKPYLFDDYIIVSPSLWWDNEKMVNSADTYLNTHKNLNKKIYVSLGKEHPVMHEVADKLVKAIRDTNNKNIELYYEPILEENHATILHKAVYAAFEKLNGGGE
ncbi:MAG TPA: alpha/beta hydrolase [Bacteroidetes bacterium]|nr:alpha/beta hydrolase [Bacteroidota bacterium]